ncbi:MAG: bifunctional diguanylate cyclase/phosphodiesterase [Maritimibacter sp.]
MPVDYGSRIQILKRIIHAVLLGPQLAAFIPALMLGAYWFGGEAVLMILALIFPALLALAGFITRTPHTPGRRDPVTGLPGRALLVRRLDQNIAHYPHDGRHASACFALELDNYHALERQYGPEAAAKVLQQATQLIREVLREEDTLAQLGPGQFAIAITQTARTDLETLIQVSNRLQEALSNPLSFDHTRVLITCSIGFAMPSRVVAQTGEAYLTAAESALHEATEYGPGSIRAYTKGMRPRHDTASDSVVKDVVKALDDGQIRPWYQPQISTDTGEITGFEALARWIHPEKGPISPAAFLPAIARGGLYERLGEVMLFHALSAIKEWDKAGVNVPSVAVNFSPDELRNPKLFDKIRWELDRFDLTPDRLTVEILEDVVAKSDDDTTTRNIAALSRIGCRIDLDDFGTGHASISNIRRFDVNRIKIDRSFITHVDTDRDQQNMVAAILTMAERLGLDTLGEGVESHGEHAMLAQLGCAHVQGYSIAKPMPLEKTAEWITEHTQRIAKTPPLPRQAG